MLAYAQNCSCHNNTSQRQTILLDRLIVFSYYTTKYLTIIKHYKEKEFTLLKAGSVISNSVLLRD
jgi:hypothetical protein